MNITKAQITAQFNRALKNGWIPSFKEAAKTYTAGLFDTADLMALGSRESNLDPKWLTKAGDHGNGFGLMQADKRSFPEFTKGDGWKDARTGILFGAKVLRQKWDDTQSSIGQKRAVTSSKTRKTSYFTGKDVGKGLEAQRVTIAAYNCGRWAHYAVSNGKGADTYTTGKDYAADVMARAAIFRQLLKNSAAAPAEKPTVTENSATPSPEQPSIAVPPSTEQPPSPQVAVELSNANEQSVEEVVKQEEPSPYQGKGFWSVIKADLAAVTGGNLTFTGLSEYIQHASGWPEWAIAIIGKVAVGALVASFGYLVFRVIHYGVDSWKQAMRSKILAEINTDKNRKDLEFVPRGDWQNADLPKLPEQPLSITQ